MHSFTLKNGLVLLVGENNMADIIAARVFIRFGNRYEPRHRAGLAHLLAAVLTKGTTTLNGLEIAEKVESVGAGLGADAAADYFLVSLKGVSANFAALLSLVAQLLRSPSFPEDEVLLERNMTLQMLRSQQEQPFTLAFNQMRQVMYPDHPYGVPGLGTEETVAQLERQDLLEAHATYFRPDNMVISVAGRIRSEEAIALVKQHFEDWSVPSEPLPGLFLPFLSPQSQPTFTTQAVQQAIVMLGYLGAPVQSNLVQNNRVQSNLVQSNSAQKSSLHRSQNDQERGDHFVNSSIADYAALKLLSTYLGNGLSSRLFVELREKRGLAYEVSALYPTRIEPANFVVYLGTAPENVAIALEGLQSEVERLCASPLSQIELQTAQNKLLGQYALGKQTNAQVAQVFGWYEVLGLGVDFDEQFQATIKAVTPDLAQAVAQRYLTTPFLSLVGPESSLSKVIH